MAMSLQGSFDSAPFWARPGYDEVSSDGRITAYHPQYGSNYAGQNLSDVQAMIADEQKRKQQITSGADFSGYENSLKSLMANPSSIQNDPSYQFRFDQGNQAINRSAAAKGMGGSGNVLAALAKYGQGMASEEYGNQFNRLSDLINSKKQFGLSSGLFDNWKSKLPSNVMLGNQQNTPSYW